MKRIHVSVEDITKRLKKSGMSNKEIQVLLRQQADVNKMKIIPDKDAIAGILRKNEEDAELKVKPFKLTREQYDALLNYFKDAASSSHDNLDADTLVHKVIDEFVGWL
jgi:hypothetical protein